MLLSSEECVPIPNNLVLWVTACVVDNIIYFLDYKLLLHCVKPYKKNIASVLVTTLLDQ